MDAKRTLSTINGSYIEPRRWIEFVKRLIVRQSGLYGLSEVKASKAVTTEKNS